MKGELSLNCFVQRRCDIWNTLQLKQGARMFSGKKMTGHSIRKFTTTEASKGLQFLFICVFTQGSQPLPVFQREMMISIIYSSFHLPNNGVCGVQFVLFFIGLQFCLPRAQRTRANNILRAMFFTFNSNGLKTFIFLYSLLLSQGVL